MGIGMSLISEIRDDILNTAVPLASILRKAKVLAYKLKSEELKTWVDQELSGYGGVSPDGLPDYRRFRVRSYCTFTNGFWVLSNQPAPIHRFKDQEAIDAAELHAAGASVSVLESSLQSDNQTFNSPWESPLLDYLNQSGLLEHGVRCIGAHRSIGRGTIEHVLDSIRTRLLNFLLEIEEMNPDSDSVPPLKKVPPTQTDRMVRSLIIGNNNVVAAGEQISQTVEMRVERGDLASLKAELKRIGVDDQDTDELETAIKSDGPASKDKKFGAKVCEWMGNLTKKMLNGGGKLVITTAPGVIEKALSAYYGWK
jgi:hypothetical protein